MEIDEQNPIAWTGFYLEGSQKTPFQVQNMKIDSQGLFHGKGENYSGRYVVNGKLNRDGSFNFNLISNGNAPKKQFSGRLTNSGVLQGLFFAPGYDATAFELKTNSEEWIGGLTQMNGQKFEMCLSLVTSKTLYGLGID